MCSRRLIADPNRRRSLKQGLASELRNSATDAERKLWSKLRSKQFAGLRFRRQQPIGPYIADFYCSAAKLVVELDGDQHGDDRHVQYDAVRTRWLSTQGYRVLRFPNGEFLRNPQAVLDGIWNALNDSGIPLPKPPSAV
ncbi:MAG TPA: endonuclease domain-containing protein [Rhizomicrobium sp.]